MSFFGAAVASELITMNETICVISFFIVIYLGVKWRNPRSGSMELFVGFHDLDSKKMNFFQKKGYGLQPEEGSKPPFSGRRVIQTFQKLLQEGIQGQWGLHPMKRVVTPQVLHSALWRV